MNIEPTTTIGNRLKLERQRLNLTQSDVLEILRIGSKNTLISWESSERSPSAEQLAILANHGFDILYLVTGKHNFVFVPANEDRLIDAYRASGDEVKALFDAMSYDIVRRKIAKIKQDNQTPAKKS